MGKGIFNGGLEAAWIIFNQYKVFGGVVVVATIFVLSVNQDHVDQAEIKARLKIQATVQDDVLVRQDRIFTYMKDSLTTNSDIDALLAQTQGVHDDLYKRIDGKNYVPGRILYRKTYGPMPSKHFEHWFWQE